MMHNLTGYATGENAQPTQAMLQGGNLLKLYEL